MWGPEWDRLAECRVIGPDQHFLLESAEANRGYKEHMALAEMNTEALDRYDRKVIEGALSECFDYHSLSGVKYDRKNRYYDVWYQDIGGKRRELMLTKTADDWFWVHFYQSLSWREGSLITLIPYRWRCDGARGVANLIRDVACRSYRSSVLP